MKIKLIPAKTKWGKRMEKIYSTDELKVISKMFIEGLGIKVDAIIIQ
jgi:hypothetical protein